MAAGRKCRQHDKLLRVVMYNKRNIVLDLYVGFRRIINTLLNHCLITSGTAGKDNNINNIEWSWSLFRNGGPPLTCTTGFPDPLLSALFQVLSFLLTETKVFCDMMPFELANNFQRLEEVCCPFLEDLNILIILRP
jgi:hypothetical protein